MAARDAESRPFPLLIILFCGLVGLMLFFSSTVPAVAERGELRHLEHSRRALLELLGQQNRAFAHTERALEFDPQTVLVEIDKLGLVPEELLARFPDDPEQGDATGQPR